MLNREEKDGQIFWKWDQSAADIKAREEFVMAVKKSDALTELLRKSIDALSEAIVKASADEVIAWQSIYAATGLDPEEFDLQYNSITQSFVQTKKH